MNTTSLTFTRFSAALLVFIFHFGKKITPFDLPYISSFIRNGNIAVSYFFFLSGFVLTIAYINRHKSIHIFDFWFKRLARIYPLYLVALISYCALCILLGFSQFGIKNLLLNLFLLQSWSESTAITLNYPGWSLSVEAFFYFSFPLIFSYLIKLNIKSLVFITLLTWIISQILTYKLNIYYNPLIHFNTFLFGISTGIILVKKAESNFIKKIKGYASILFTLGIIILLSLLLFPSIIPLQNHNGLFAPLYTLIITGLIYSNNIITKVFSLKWAIILGEISYGFYILQYPSLVVTKYINDKMNKALFQAEDNSFLAHFSVLLILSFLSYYLIENPVKKWVSKRSKRNTLNI